MYVVGRTRSTYCYVSTKLEVFKAFLFREIGGTGWTDGQTDGRVQHNAAGH